MKKLVLNIGLLFVTSISVFSQKDDFKKFGLNNDVVNYILKGDYQKVINITKSSNFEYISLSDTNWQLSQVFNKTNTLAEQDLISYLGRIKDIVNAPNLESAIQSPHGVMIEANNWSMTDDHLRGTPRENEMKTYATRNYVFTRGNHTIYFILAFEDSKLDAIGIHFRVTNLD